MITTIRRATMADASDISTLIAESAHELGRSDYSDEVIEAALKSAWGLDTQLVEDGTYFSCMSIVVSWPPAAVGVSEARYLGRTVWRLAMRRIFPRTGMRRAFERFL